MSLSKSKYAGQAEILRAAQKDENYIRELHEITSNLTLLGGRKFWLKYANYHIVFSRLLYYCCTTVFSLQTLGEEYTGIIPIDKAYSKLLSFQKLILYVTLLSGGHLIFTNLLMKLEKIEWPESIYKCVNPTVVIGIKIVTRVLINLIPYLGRINKTLFYFNGSYYSLVNRILGVKHVLFQSWLRDEESLYGFKILAGVSLMNLIASFLHSYPNWSKTDPDIKLITVSADGPASSQNICKLCLNVRNNTSITPCGHLFCWNCIMEWLHFRKDCPLCKSPVSSPRIIFLHNYDQFSSS